MVPELSTDYADYADSTEDLGHFSRPYGTDLIGTHGPSTEVLGYVESVLSGRQNVSCGPRRGAWQVRVKSFAEGRHDVASGVSPWKKDGFIIPSPRRGRQKEHFRRISFLSPPAGAFFFFSPRFHGLTPEATSCRPPLADFSPVAAARS